MINYTLEDKLYLKKMIVNVTSSLEQKLKHNIDGKSHWGKRELKELVHWAVVQVLYDQGISIDCMPEFIKTKAGVDTKFTKKRTEDILVLKERMDAESERFIAASIKASEKHNE